MADAFGRALLDHYRGEREASLIQRDGDDTAVHHVGDYYFGSFPAEPAADWTESWLSGPLVDLGAGAGRDALYFQDVTETVALEVSESLVTLLSERGVREVRHGDMFALRESFADDQFGSALALGTQVGLAGSTAGLQAFLASLAAVTTDDATAVIDAYDPTYGGASEMLGYRSDSTPGLAHRVLHYEYADRVGPTLLFRLYSPDRLREVAADTAWTVADVRRPHAAYYYRAALRKA